MKITNKHGLPEVFVRMAREDVHVMSGVRSVTQLLDPPQKFQLMKEHGDDLEMDVSDWSSISAMIGKAVHRELARWDDVNTTEMQLETEVEGWKISGRPDVVNEGEGLIVDWKVTSTFSGIFNTGAKPEWAQQIQLYSALLLTRGIKMTKGKVWMIYRDWKKGMANKGGDYPPVCVESRTVTVDDHDANWALLEERVKIHQEADTAKTYAECSEEERWAREKKWALMKGGNKKATKLFKSAEAAHTAADKAGPGYRVDFRHPVNARCEDWCFAAPVCEQFKKLRRHGPPRA